jgi:hypothetical protein
MLILVAPSAGHGRLLLLPLIPLALMLSRKRLRVGSPRRLGWDDSVGVRRLAAHPGDPVARCAYAPQRQARCADAVDDLRLAFESRAETAALQPGTLFDTGVLLGLCQMAVQDFRRRATWSGSRRGAGTLEPPTTSA